MLSRWGKLVANKFLKFPRGTNLSSYTQLYVAFFLSALFHTFGETIHERRMTYRNLKFFLLQAVGITFEDFIVYVAKRLLVQRGIKPNAGKADGGWVHAAVRVIGYCWLLLWFCLTLPVWVDEFSVAGSGNVDRGPIARFLAGKWKQWA